MAQSLLTEDEGSFTRGGQHDEEMIFLNVSVKNDDGSLRTHRYDIFFICACTCEIKTKSILKAPTVFSSLLKSLSS